MEVIRGLKVSRKYQGPASTLYNVVDPQGDNFMAIQFHEEFHDNNEQSQHRHNRG